MVYQVSQLVKIPVIGMGGIQNARDVIKMCQLNCKCCCNWLSEFEIDPYVCRKIINDLEPLLEQIGISNYKQFGWTFT